MLILMHSWDVPGKANSSSSNSRFDNTKGSRTFQLVLRQMQVLPDERISLSTFFEHPMDTSITGKKVCDVEQEEDIETEKTDTEDEAGATPKTKTGDDAEPARTTKAPLPKIILPVQSLSIEAQAQTNIAPAPAPTVKKGKRKAVGATEAV